MRYHFRYHQYMPRQWMFFAAGALAIGAIPNAAFLLQGSIILSHWKVTVVTVLFMLSCVLSVSCICSPPRRFLFALCLITLVLNAGFLFFLMYDIAAALKGYNADQWMLYSP